MLNLQFMNATVPGQADKLRWQKFKVNLIERNPLLRVFCLSLFSLFLECVCVRIQNAETDSESCRNYTLCDSCVRLHHARNCHLL